MDGGVGVWKVILARRPGLKDFEFSGHGGCALEVAASFKKKRMVELLLQHGANTYPNGSEGDSIVQLVEGWDCGEDIMTLLKKHV